MIGIFDSGSGGLTVLKAIRERLKSPDIIYFGDIKNAPYGSRSHEELSHLTMDSIRFLRARGARSIVSACNSVSASLALSLLDTLDMTPARLIEMVAPTVSLFRKTDKRIMLAATPATIKSGLYRLGFKMIGKEVREVPIPDLAGAIEFGEPDDVLEKKIRDAFADVDKRSYDVLVLACTHYPLALPLFKKIFDSHIIVDPADVVAERTEQEFWPLEAGDGKTHFVISKDSEHFRTLVQNIFPQLEYTIEVLS